MTLLPEHPGEQAAGHARECRSEPRKTCDRAEHARKIS